MSGTSNPESTSPRSSRRWRGLTGSALVHLRTALVQFIARDRLRAAALTFFALLSLFPLLVLAIRAGNLLLGDAVFVEQIDRLVKRLFPGDLPDAIIAGITEAVNQEQGLSLVALAGLVWGATAFFSNLAIAMDTIFGTQPTPRPLWRNRLVGAVMILGLGAVVFLTIVVTAGVRLFSQTTLPAPSALMRPVSLLAPPLLSFGMLSLTFRYVPRAVVPWRAIVGGALFGSVGWEISRAVFAWYLGNLATYNVIYGSLGVIIALLIWVNVSISVLLISAEVSASMARTPSFPAKA